ncbi:MULTISPECIES: dihydropteroate synthase [Planococcus]|uniref:Dihydropteroate synthase n=1 Tax=Planococcus kocurii TaxID=1374 RepID=A0ABM5X0L4_9BACL|nr:MULTISPECIES: dihydropteroate synthase [Planococcus]ALS80143.1 dihydropteroate synthase [Planococcus kocurii]KAA0954804.1 dihydropteroate synthase [Planococcus sp. ANT_H30]MDJ0333264.1 dihydropteroate synthase [Planococcus sp. S3-L1]
MEINFTNKTLVMGILNVTPDSFSDGGKYAGVEQALSHAKQMVEEGVDIIDVGGESTRPGHVRISDQEEIERIVPVIKALREHFDVLISVDTYKSRVADAAIAAGAHIINDIWGAKFDPLIASVAAKWNVPMILMHNRHHASYSNFREDMMQDLSESIEIALAAGVRKEHIWLDPGVGFAKTVTQNLQAIQLVEQMVELGYPILLGTSRKSFIGKILDTTVEERLEGSLATICCGISHGCHVVRVHDVKETVRTVRMMDALTGKRPYKEEK